ncbi:MAG: HepT-like ribonuclease domain-containing protein [Candidatus Odinarchaeia archaeon]
MPKRDDLVLLEDIREAINRIEEYVADYNYNQFLSDYKTQDAVVRNLEVIGEAVKKISSKLKEKYANNINWRGIAGLRDRLIHQYFGINYDIIWTIIKEELPIISKVINQILKNNY